MIVCLYYGAVKHQCYYPNFKKTHSSLNNVHQSGNQNVMKWPIYSCTIRLYLLLKLYSKTGRIRKREREKERGSDKTGCGWMAGKGARVGSDTEGSKGSRRVWALKVELYKKETVSLSLCGCSDGSHSSSKLKLTTFQAKVWRKLCFVPGLYTLYNVIGWFL